MELSVFLLCILLSAGVLASGPDSIGKEFLYSLSAGTTGTINLIVADVSETLCAVTSGTNTTHVSIKRGKQRQLGVSGSFQISCDDAIIATLSVGRALSNLLPVDVLGTEYTAIAADNDCVATAMEDDTELTIKPKAEGRISVDRIDYDPSGAVKLNKGESRVVTHSNQLAGTKIKSNKPISVLNGDVSLPPQNTWGNEYLLTASNSTPYQYKVIGDTICQVNGKRIQFPARNLSLTMSGVIKCNSAVLVGLFINETLVTILPSTGQFPNIFNMLVADSNSAHHLYIQVSRSLADEILINNVAANKFPSQKASMEIYKDFIQLHYEVFNGTYEIYSKRPTTVVYGYITDETGNIKAISPVRMANTGVYCNPNKNVENNDGLDNDCDNKVDEELENSKDDDGDGLVDEDIASNKFYGDLRKPWPLSYTVLLIVLLLVLFSIFVAICHWQCGMCNPAIEEEDTNIMVTSVDSTSAAPPRYTFSGSRAGFTISRR
ncbi:uncharacterized protein [Watersipora subatra]|uniref:uncharacterized protein n=1 Tax=Watersipora subatra TaxID=2589382 RepID=UPI00355BFEFD